MQLEQLVLPTLATVALGTALLVPLRDGRRGKRATLTGLAPLRPDFRIVDRERADDAASNVGASETAGETHQARSDDDIENDTGSVAQHSASHAPGAAPLDTEPARREAQTQTVRPNDPRDLGAETTLTSSVGARQQVGMPPRRWTGLAHFFARKTNVTAADASQSQAAIAESPLGRSIDLLRQVARCFSVGASAVAATADITEPQGSSDATHIVPAPSPVTVERSFADELHRLLRAAPVGENARAAQATPEIEADPAVPDGVLPHFSHGTPAFLTSPPATAPAAAPFAPSGSIEVSDVELLPHRVPALRLPFEPVVPLTRLPLRPQSETITWPTRLYDALNFANDAAIAATDHAARRALLLRLAHSATVDAAATLHVAYREEDGQGRALALRALMRLEADEHACAIYADALRSGTDDERSLAIDALARAGEREALVEALDDRIDAIAAKAALAYVGSNDQRVFRAVLAPLVGQARLAAILSLLAGFVE